MESTDIQYKSRIDSRNERVRLASTLVTRKSPKICKTQNAQIEKNRTNVQSTKIENTKNEKNTIESQKTNWNRIYFGNLVIGGLIVSAI